MRALLLVALLAAGLCGPTVAADINTAATGANITHKDTDDVGDGNKPPVCGIPGLALDNWPYGTLSLNRSGNLWFLTPCGQVLNNISSSIGCYTSDASNPVMACNILTSYDNFQLAHWSERDQAAAQWTEIETANKRSLQLVTSSGETCSPQSQPWSLTAEFQCFGDYDWPELVSFETTGDCSAMAIVKTNRACRCGVPQLSLSHWSDYGPLQWYDPARRGRWTLSPCGIASETRCALMGNGFQKRSTLCAEYDDGQVESWMQYRPETARWTVTYDSHDNPTVSMTQSGFCYFVGSWSATMTVNYVCDAVAVRPYIHNVDYDFEQCRSTVHVRTAIICSLIGSNPNRSSSTGVDDDWDSLDDGPTVEHLIAILIINLLVLIVVLAVCYRARKHLARWSSPTPPPIQLYEGVALNDAYQHEYDEAQYHQPHYHQPQPQDYYYYQQQPARYPVAGEQPPAAGHSRAHNYQQLYEMR